MNEASIHDVSAIVLSAGKSERFGKPKAFLAFNQTNTFIQHLIFEYYHAGICNIIIVTNKDLLDEMNRQIQNIPANININIVVNTHTELGRFSSIKRAVDTINTGCNAFIQNIDNPFTTTILLRRMMDAFVEGSYVVPTFDNERGHPVLVSHKIIQHIKEMDMMDTNLRDVLSQFPVIEIQADDPTIHANINTPEAYIMYFNHAVLH